MARRKPSRSSTTSRSRSKRSSPGSSRGKPARPTSRTTSKSRGSSGKRRQPAQLAAIAALGRLADQLQVGWYLFGAQAVAVWGAPRLTADVDVTFEMEPARTAELLRAGRPEAVRPREPDVERLARETRVLPVEIGRRGIAVDIVLAGSELERRFLKRAVQVDLAGSLTPVISAEDLIATKILAGRPRDLEDVLGILTARRSSLDLEYVRALLAEIDAALERSDLLASFEQLQASAP